MFSYQSLTYATSRSTDILLIEKRDLEQFIYESGQHERTENISRGKKSSFTLKNPNTENIPKISVISDLQGVIKAVQSLTHPEIISLTNVRDALKK